MLNQEAETRLEQKKTRVDLMYRDLIAELKKQFGKAQHQKVHAQMRIAQQIIEGVKPGGTGGAGTGRAPRMKKDDCQVGNIKEHTPADTIGDSNQIAESPDADGDLFARMLLMLLACCHIHRKHRRRQNVWRFESNRRIARAVRKIADV